MKTTFFTCAVAVLVLFGACTKDDSHGTLTIRYGDPSETGKWTPKELLLYSVENRAKVLHQIKTENYRSVQLKLEEGGYLLKTSDGKLEYMFNISAGKSVKVYYSRNSLGKDDSKSQ